MKQAFVAVILVLCGVILYVSLASENEENPNKLSPELDRHFASMWFHNHSGMYRCDFTFRIQGYTHIIFVRSEDEFLAIDFPDDAVVAWPSLYTYLMIDGINSFIRENEEYDNTLLEYPVTMEDMFDNWKNVQSFLSEMRGAGTTSRFNRIAPSVREEYSRIINAELEMLNEAIEASNIDVSLYGFELPVTWGISRLGFSANLILVFEVYAQLDEDVRKQLELPNLYARFRDTRRMLDWDDENFGNTTLTPRDQAFGFPENYTGRIRAWEFW